MRLTVTIKKGQHDKVIDALQELMHSGIVFELEECRFGIAGLVFNQDNSLSGEIVVDVDLRKHKDDFDRMRDDWQKGRDVLEWLKRIGFQP